MTEAAVAKLTNAFSVGANDAEACRFAGISQDTFYRHLKDDAEFCVSMEAIKDRPVLKAKSVVIKSINDGHLPTAQWFLERKCKKEFATHQDIDVTSKGERVGFNMNVVKSP